MPSIDAITDMGHRNAATLRKARVRTTEALLKRASSPAARKELAGQTGLDQDDLLAWANRADLLRVKGVGPEYAFILSKAGVDTLKELRRRNPANLIRSMTDLNGKIGTIRRLPTPEMVAAWIAIAQTTNPLVVR
jgi:predicted flap endonuclease-1-like 5' DNA nuclease